ncbi:hypothetical protein OsI_16360 [Oryza sativa Indica Group]|uniref:Uncharacterized protein n=2 Tax=Oryza sativa TaxID=4530 RepID=B9FFS4_ORYSJ|nr:hypothetical protein OsI_16360 [Oryza sativa Indica Group]EEE61208.1 hypothetical protein OsJ_15228 [Oryza sativa Japonica Group]
MESVQKLPKWTETEDQQATFDDPQDEEAAEVGQELEEAPQGGPEPTWWLHWQTLFSLLQTQPTGKRPRTNKAPRILNSKRSFRLTKILTSNLASNPKRKKPRNVTTSSREENLQQGLSRTGHHPSEIKGFSKKENSEDGWTQEPNPGQAKDNLGEAASRVSEQQDRRSGASSLVSGDTQAVLLLAGAWRN